VGKLKAVHIMCKRDTESAKVAPESVLSNRWNLEGTHLTRFSLGFISGGLSPYTGLSQQRHRHDCIYHNQRSRWPINARTCNSSGFADLFRQRPLLSASVGGHTSI